MKAFVVFFLAVVAVAVARPSEEKYTVKFDNVNLDEILKSDRLTKNYVDCLLGEKPCPTDGAELKRVLPDALKTNCAKCSEKQKEGSRKVIQHLYKNKKDWWNALEKKYDPEQVYVKENAEELKKL